MTEGIGATGAAPILSVTVRGGLPRICPKAGPIRIVLPGDTGYQVLDAANRSAGDALVMAAPPAGQAIAAGRTRVIAFTARGTTSTPARSTFTDSGRPRPRPARAPPRLVTVPRPPRGAR